MSDFDEGLAAGLAIGKKKWGKGGNETEEKWKYPEEWLPLPTPAENEVCFLIMLNKNKFESRELVLHGRYDSYEGSGVIVDWGDGIVDDYPAGYNVKHIYTAGKGAALSDNIEMYIIKAAYRGTAKFDEISEWDNAISTVAAAIDGSAMSRNNQSPNGVFFYNPNSLRYLRLVGDPAYWEERTYSGFNAGTYALARVDFDFSRKVTKLPPYTFMSCMSLTDANMPDLSEIKECSNGCFDFCPCLKKISLPKLETSSGYSLVNNYSVQEMNLPKLRTIGSENMPARSMFQNYYGLKELSLPSLKTVYAELGTSAFNNCYSLERLDMPELTTMTVSARNIGVYSRSMRRLNAPNVDTTGWFSQSPCI